MSRKMTVKKQNTHLASAYQKITDEGRDVLDTVIQKLAEIHWKPEEMEQKELDLTQEEQDYPVSAE